MKSTLANNSLPKFFWVFCKRHIASLVILFSIIVYWAASLSLNPYLLKLLIDRMAESNAGGEELISLLLLPAALYVSLTLATSIVLRVYDWTMLKFFPKLKQEITSELFSRLLHHSYHFFQLNFSGNLASKINDLSKSAAMVLFYLIDQFLTRFLSLSIGTAVMCLVHPAFAAIFISWCVMFITTCILLLNQSQKHSERYSNARSLVVGRLVDSISNILNIKLFAREKWERSILQTSLEGLVHEDRRFQWFLIKIKTLYSLSITLLTALMVWLLISERSKGNITVGDCALILTLTTVLVRDIFLITNQLTHFSEELGSCRQALSLLSSPPEILDLPGSQALRVTVGSIVFDQVHFAYRQQRPLFSGLSLRIPGGQKVGIVGLSGSGKTSLVNLILRFFDVQGGSISIDGQNIKEVSQESLRSQIAMIPQDPVLFHRSILENIRYGRPEASDAEVFEAARKAHCHEFIQNLKEGYESLVGEKGVKLSGGQRQCIGIARALLKNAPILLLDEATSSLDSSTEERIQERLSGLMQGKTCLVVAHRLSTLSHLDRILVIHQGQIIEDGPHEQLIRAEGRYQKLWSIQARGVSPRDCPIINRTNSRV